MKISIYKPDNADEIEQLFIKTFSDSEGRSEGELTGRLVKEMMASADANDLYCFVATENEQIIGGVFFTRMILKMALMPSFCLPWLHSPSIKGRGWGRS